MMHPDEYYKIAEQENKHWWYRALHNLVLSTLNRTFCDKGISIIDAGCGTGGLMTFLQNNGYHNVKGFDISEIAVNLCKDRGLDVFQGDIKEVLKYFSNKQVDVIVSNDTFYFLDEIQQRNVTDIMYGLLKDKGLLILNMPSLQAFKGIHDLRVGIVKRFSKRDIGNLYDHSKYVLITEMYWPFLLSFGIGLIRYMQKIKMKVNKLTVINSDLKNYGRVINSLLFHLTNSENKILHKKPFGSSLFLVLRK